MRKPYIIGISGASGSGKTSFINQLIAHIPACEVCLISMDNYYKPRHLQPIDENGYENYDTLQSLATDELLNDLSSLSAGNTVERVEYDFNNPDYNPKKILLKPAKIMVLEGLYLFSYPEIFNLLDTKIFIEADDHLRISRRLKRDITERGYTVEQTLYWMQNHVEPAYKNLVLPYRSLADVIVPNNKSFDKAIEVLSAYIQKKLND